MKISRRSIVGPRPRPRPQPSAPAGFRPSLAPEPETQSGGGGGGARGTPTSVSGHYRRPALSGSSSAGPMRRFSNNQTVGFADVESLARVLKRDTPVSPGSESLLAVPLDDHRPPGQLFRLFATRSGSVARVANGRNFFLPWLQPRCSRSAPYSRSTSTQRPTPTSTSWWLTASRAYRGKSPPSSRGTSSPTIPCNASGAACRSTPAGCPWPVSLLTPVQVVLNRMIAQSARPVCENSRYRLLHLPGRHGQLRRDLPRVLIHRAWRHRRALPNGATTIISGGASLLFDANLRALDELQSRSWISWTNYHDRERPTTARRSPRGAGLDHGVKTAAPRPSGPGPASARHPCLGERSEDRAS